ncbi:hypothetical protein [Pontibacter virosus]|uniref:hypothetical protein n=1 Tax=Pontibacter virosus TaxID=1765052 RepID=UPI000E300862|nr:hypothetical protein [Pontibacter virosus]
MATRFWFYTIIARFLYFTAARFSGGRSGKARKLNYHCSMAVDTATGVISHTRADFADGRDSQHLPSLVTQVKAG